MTLSPIITHVKYHLKLLVAKFLLSMIFLKWTRNNAPNNTIGRIIMLKSSDNLDIFGVTFVSKMWFEKYGKRHMASPFSPLQGTATTPVSPSSNLFLLSRRTHTNILHLHKRCMPQTQENFNLQDTWRLAAHSLSARLCYSLQPVMAAYRAGRSTI